jgi:hypothetical protein
MQPDDVEARLRRQLRAELDQLSLEIDGGALRERLAERERRPAWWRRSSRRVATGVLGAVVVLVAVMASAVLLRVLPTTAPSVGGPSVPAAPHVLLVRELPQGPISASIGPPPLEGRLADPLTLKPAAGLSAIKLGRFYQAALSHDGRKLAIIRWPNESPYGGQLVVLDLWTGAQTTTGVVVDGEAPVLAFSDDDTSLSWIVGQRGQSSANYSVARYALGGKAASVKDLPSGYWPMDGRLLANDELAVTFGTVSESGNGSSVPHVVFIAADGTLRADLPLPGVLAGDHPRDDGRVAIDNPGLAWDIRSGRLYVVHPDADVVTVVDLAAHRIVAQVDAAAHASAWLGALGVGVAAAKLEPGSDRSAALSPDGSRLYVVGSLRTVTGTGPDATFSQTPVGGFVLDTRTLSRLETIDLPVDRVAVAPSGRTLLFSATKVDPTVEAESEAATHSELIATDTSLRITARKTVPPHAWVIGLAQDGRHAYVELGNTVATVSLDGLTQVSLGSGYWVDPSLK